MPDRKSKPAKRETYVFNDAVHVQRTIEIDGKRVEVRAGQIKTDDPAIAEALRGMYGIEEVR